MTHLLTRLARRCMRLAHEDLENRIYRRRLTDLPPLAPVAIRVDFVADLEKFRVSERWHDKAAIMSIWMKRLAGGSHAYTIADADTLLHVGWMNPSITSSVFTEVGQRFEYPPRTAALYDFYTDPAARGRGFYRANIARMLADLSTVEEGPDWVYMNVLADNAPSRHVIEKIGFHYQGSQFRRSNLGWARRWSTI